MRPSLLYSREFLLAELYNSARLMSRNEYAHFQLGAINKYVKMLASDFLTVNILHMNSKGFPDGEIVSVVANHPNSVIGNYQKNLSYDLFTPLTFQHPGSALFVEAVRPMNEWECSDIYKKHCTPYGQYWVVGLSYLFPHKKKTYLAFDYMRAQGEKGYSDKLTEEFIEYISYPFYLGWLYPSPYT